MTLRTMRTAIKNCGCNSNYDTARRSLLRPLHGHLKNENSEKKKKAGKLTTNINEDRFLAFIFNRFITLNNAAFSIFNRLAGCRRVKRLRNSHSRVLKTCLPWLVFNKCYQNTNGPFSGAGPTN